METCVLEHTRLNIPYTFNIICRLLSMYILMYSRITKGGYNADILSVKNVILQYFYRVNEHESH